MEIIVVSAFVVFIVAAILAVKTIRDDIKQELAELKAKENARSDALAGTPKQWGIFMLKSGLWRRNRLKNKH